MIIDVLFQAENLTAKYPFFKVPLVFTICDYSKVSIKRPVLLNDLV